MTRCAILALGQQRQICIAAEYINQGPEEKLLPIFRTVKAHGENAWHIWRGQFGLWINSDVADLMAKITGDALRGNSFQRYLECRLKKSLNRGLNCQAGLAPRPGTVLVIGRRGCQ